VTSNPTAEWIAHQLTDGSELFCRWIRIRRAIGRSNSSAGSPLSRSSAAFITNMPMFILFTSLGILGCMALPGWVMMRLARKAA